jgi:hypothetical protein
MHTSGGTNASYAFNVTTDCPDEALIKNINYYAYTHLTPALVCVGCIGDLLTIYILSQPVRRQFKININKFNPHKPCFLQILRSASVIYMYLTHLAVTDLFTLLSVLPMTFYMCDIRVG